jgi:hypothetical protein
VTGVVSFGRACGFDFDADYALAAQLDNDVDFVAALFLTQVVEACSGV